MNGDVLRAALYSIPSPLRGGGKRSPLAGGATILFPHRTDGEPPMAAVLCHGPNKLYIGGIRLDGRPFTLTPDSQTERLLRAEFFRRRRRDLDPESGVPV